MTLTVDIDLDIKFIGQGIQKQKKLTISDFDENNFKYFPADHFIMRPAPHYTLHSVRVGVSSVSFVFVT